VKIDVHNHAFPVEALDLLRRDQTYGVTLNGSRWHGGKHVDFEVVPAFVEPEAKLAELESKGLDGAIVSVAPPLLNHHVDAEAGETMSRTSNDGLRAIVAAAPDRFRWLATVPLQDVDRAVAVLEDAARDGCVGVQIGTTVAGQRLDDEALAPFWAATERLGLPVTIHPAYNDPHAGMADFYFDNVIGNQLETTIAVERLIASGTLARHPGVRLVLVHAGGYFPWQAGRMRHARTVRPELADAPNPWDHLGQIWFDTITHDRRALGFLIEQVGLERVVMGTDLSFDMATPEPVADVLAATDEDTLRTVAEVNPAKLYGLD
jgi:aminocarboxymuconate-semialdehyde decarboxylase